LTELIERHERWRAEGGEKDREDELNHHDSRAEAVEDDDLWDFGTVRHVPARQNHIPEARPTPTLSQHAEEGRRSVRSRVSTGSARRIVNPNMVPPPQVRPEPHDLPPIPHDRIPSDELFPEEGTLRYTAPSIRREAHFPPETYEGHPPHNPNEEVLTDATMLDSVILPAIVAVRTKSEILLLVLIFLIAFPSGGVYRGTRCFEQSSTSVPRCRADYSGPL
jgi:serine/threonine-protein kinase 24/25/MST4